MTNLFQCDTISENCFTKGKVYTKKKHTPKEKHTRKEKYNGKQNQGDNTGSFQQLN